MKTLTILITPEGATCGPSADTATQYANILNGGGSATDNVKAELRFDESSAYTVLFINGQPFGRHYMLYDVAYWIGQHSSSVNPQRLQSFLEEQLLLAAGWQPATLATA